MSDSEDEFPHEDDYEVISVITMGRNVHRVLVDKGSSTDVMFWETFLGIKIPLDQLRPFDSCLDRFTRDQVEVRGYAELRTTFSDEDAGTIMVKYIVVNTPSAYNFLLGLLSLRCGALHVSYEVKATLVRRKSDHHEGG